MIHGVGTARVSEEDIECVAVGLQVRTGRPSLSSIPVSRLDFSQVIRFPYVTVQHSLSIHGYIPTMSPPRLH